MPDNPETPSPEAIQRQLDDLLGPGAVRLRRTEIHLPDGIVMNTENNEPASRPGSELN